MNAIIIESRHSVISFVKLRNSRPYIFVDSIRLITNCFTSMLKYLQEKRSCFSVEIWNYCFLIISEFLLTVELIKFLIRRIRNITRSHHFLLRSNGVMSTVHS